MKWTIWPAAVVAGFFVSAAIAEDQSVEELKRDAVSRLVEAHDVALPVYIGRVYVKQAALTAARDLLAEKGKAAGLDRKKWNMDSPQWQGAERELMQGTDALIQRKVASGFWVQEAWSEQVSDHPEWRRSRRNRGSLPHRGRRTATPCHRMVRR